MRCLPTGLLLAVAVALTGCRGKPTPSAPTPNAPSEIVTVRIAPPAGDAGVVGASTPLSASVLVNGVPVTDPSQSIVWSSSNTAVARVDERGVLTGVAAGQTIVTAAVRNTTGTLALEVVPALAGTATIVWQARDCTQFNAYCVGGVPRAQSAAVTITQVGSGVEGTWGLLHWMTGSPPFSGRVHADGSMELSGSRCSLDDIGRGTLFALTDFRMQRRADGIYEGSVRHVQEGNCAGTGYRSVTDYVVALWPPAMK